MAALPNSDDPNAPDRSRPPPSHPRRTRPVHAAPPAHGEFDAEAGHETEDAHTHEDEADWQRRLRRRRRANLPGLLLAGVAALALAGGLAFWVSAGNDTAPGPASVVPGAAPTPVPPVPEQRSNGAPSRRALRRGVNPRPNFRAPLRPSRRGTLRPRQASSHRKPRRSSPR